MFENYLKEKMAKGLVYGMTIYTGSPAVIEAAGQFGLDFVFIDAEHTGFEVGTLKECIMAARLKAISPLVRVSRPDEIQIRKAWRGRRHYPACTQSGRCRNLCARREIPAERSALVEARLRFQCPVRVLLRRRL